MAETIHKQGRVKILSKCGKNIFNTFAINYFRGGGS